MEEKEFLTYKGKPLVRSKDVLYYGDMSEKYVIRMTILSSKKEDGKDVADKVKVELLLSDTALPEKDRVTKSGEKNSLYEAMDFGLIWLERALKKD